jgi:uncharacterized membrane protein YedE/YeeE
MPVPTEWLLALAGGALIGASAALLLLVNGRIAGVSGVLAGLLDPRADDREWRLLFMLGLVSGGVAARGLLPAALSARGTTVATALVAGLLVGVGTRLANGCTSGHGVCGVSRLAPRSLAATATFIATGALTVFVARRFT